MAIALISWDIPDIPVQDILHMFYSDMANPCGGINYLKIAQNSLSYFLVMKFGIALVECTMNYKIIVWKNNLKILSNLKIIFVTQ